MLAGAAALGAMLSSSLRAQSSPACSISGTITAGTTPLPGVVVSLVNGDGQQIDLTSSAPDGTYTLRVTGFGEGVLKAELTAFAPFSHAITIDQASCQQRVDIPMVLASRAPVPATPTAPSSGAAAPTAAGANPATPSTPTVRQQGNRAANAGGRSGQARGRGQQAFQTLDLVADENAAGRGDEGGGDASQSLLPPGFSTDSSSESVASIGSSQAAADAFLGPNGNFADRLNAFGDGGPGGQFGGPGGPGGPGGGPGGRGGGPGGFGGLGNAVFLGRGRGANQIRGSVFQSFDTSALDTAPYALSGKPSTKPDYLQQRFGATVGGPIGIPGIWSKDRTFFFLNYTGNHSRNPYDQYSTVPTAAERGGDLSALGGTIIDPTTGQAFTGSQIPQSRINPAAQQLLNLYPMPNQPGLLNYHTVTTTTSNIDDINIRLVHTFGAVPQRGQRGAGGRGGFGGGRGGGGRQGVSNLNIAIHYRRSDTTSANPLPSLGGSTDLSAWDIPVGYSFSKASLFHSIRFDFNRQHSATQNLFAGNTNVAGDAGLQGIASDPFDWGAPSLSFSRSGFQSLRDVTPSSRTDQTLSIGDTIVKQIGKHTVRFGGDLRSIHTDVRTDANPNGSFVFTGLYTGSDFADFLLGLPQQATVQYIHPGLEQFRQHTGDLFMQDDWRWKSNLTVNAGLRYEYYSPYSNVDNELATLDASSTFTAATPVEAGGTSPYSGVLPDTIVRPFRLGFAPRVGIAWKAQQATTVRAGYSINYNASTYLGIAQQLAAQPPFAVTNTVLATTANPLPFQTILTTAPTAATTNNYGVDPNYRLPHVHIWNVDVTRDFASVYQLGVGYTGTHGSDLDVLRAPNRNPDGTLRIPDVLPFIWESTGAYSDMNALTLRFRRRQSHGIGGGATYTLSKSIDDASSIGGTAGVVAQNDQDLAAERGLSSFDQRHRFTGTVIVDLPFGENKPWFNNGGLMSDLLGNWQVNGTLQLASGTPFTAQVLGAITDVATGVNGTLRANYNGQPIQLANPTSGLWFNTAAFSVPAAGTFGNAGRNTIIGPGTSVLNAGLMRNINLGGNRGLSIQVMANNLLNTVQFASIDTIVNSPQFGAVTAARAMRTVTVSTRFRF